MDLVYRVPVNEMPKHIDRPYLDRLVYAGGIHRLTTYASTRVGGDRSL